MRKFNEMHDANLKAETETSVGLTDIISNINMFSLLEDKGYLIGVYLKEGISIDDINDFLSENGYEGIKSTKHFHKLFAESLNNVIDIAELYYKKLNR